MSSGTFLNFLRPALLISKTNDYHSVSSQFCSPSTLPPSILRAAHTRKSLAVHYQLLPAANCSCSLPLTWENKVNSYQFTIHFRIFCNLEFLLRGPTYLSGSKLIYTPHPPTKRTSLPNLPFPVTILSIIQACLPVLELFFILHHYD